MAIFLGNPKDKKTNKIGIVNNFLVMLVKKKKCIHIACFFIFYSQGGYSATYWL